MGSLAHSAGRSHKKIILLFIGAVFLELHWAFTLYINSSFMEQFVSERNVGLLYVAAAALTIFLLYRLPRDFKRYGLYRTTVALIACNIIATAGLVLFRGHGLLIACFVVEVALPPLILYCFDIFLEHETKESNTGSVRGMYLLVLNLALIISPFATGWIVDHFTYTWVYVLSGFFLIPLLFFLESFQNNVGIHIIPVTLVVSARELRRDKNLRDSIAINFLLQFFFAVMVIYTPIYLYHHVGLSWESIGLIFTVMLVPFVLFELPLGELADKKIGEKEILICGFILIALSTALISAFDVRDVLLWMALLFATRVGASFVEIGSDTYFFKKVQARNADLISFYRGMIPLSYATAPLLVSIVLGMLDLRYIFVILGILMLLGIVVASNIKDTR